MENFTQQTEASAVSYRFMEIELVREVACRAQMNTTSSAYTMLLVTEGDGKITLSSGGARVQRGTCLLLSPGMSGLFEVGEEGMIFYRIRFEVTGRPEQSSALTGQPSFDELLSKTVMTCGSFSSCMLLVETLYRHQAEQDELELLENQIRFQTLLLFVLKQYRLGGSENGLRQEVQRSVDYVKEHYDQPITIEQLAAMTATSRWRYTQVFKEMTGQIPIDFLNTVRIDKAQQLLMMTRDKLYDIAQAVGYSNEYYFNRKFKQTVGVTPGQYRSSYESSTRIFAPFLEDYLLALDIMPVLQFTHKRWGRQEYLGLREVPDFDVTTGDWTALSRHKPEFIILDDGYHRWNLDKCSRISPVFKMPYSGEDWRITLQTFGSILGRKDKAALAIEKHESKIAEARERLARTVRNDTVAVLRISSRAVYLYGGSSRGYTGPLLYGNLGLAQPDLVRELARDERRISLTMEGLARLDADHLFITFDKEDGEGRDLLDTPIWKELKAVRSKRVYEVDFLAWMNYGVLSHNRKIDDVLKVLG
ncbi:helix-turn-helix domain-containing protein [Paenibacillus contaminans]|nr:AraC family transcriptional regulator [Paenibacillus contaminans]